MAECIICKHTHMYVCAHMYTWMEQLYILTLELFIRAETLVCYISAAWHIRAFHYLLIALELVWLCIYTSSPPLRSPHNMHCCLHSQVNTVVCNSASMLPLHWSIPGSTSCNMLHETGQLSAMNRMYSEATDCDWWTLILGITTISR